MMVSPGPSSSAAQLPAAESTPAGWSLMRASQSRQGRVKRTVQMSCAVVEVEEDKLEMPTGPGLWSMGPRIVATDTLVAPSQPLRSPGQPRPQWLQQQQQTKQDPAATQRRFKREAASEKRDTRLLNGGLTTSISSPRSQDMARAMGSSTLLGQGITSPRAASTPVDD
mmetsp:Transcript_40540/g.94808  ORF Transcript_40540/g.94808 Transcript_40540/m.94808 type:complete len:168 (+) Transcript_40540:140-643(+)